MMEVAVECDESNLLENLADISKVSLKNTRAYLDDSVELVFSDKYSLDDEDYSAEEVA